MKCPNCSEEIGDGAQVCACGAPVSVGRREPPPAPGQPAKRRSSFAIVSTGWLLALSGTWMLLNCTTAVPLLGQVRAGISAILYNAVFGALFIAMGYALTARKPWAPAATAAATVFYTIDKVLFLVDGKARRAFLETGSTLGAIDPESMQIMEDGAFITTIAFLVGWWGLALFLYFKRSYFRAGAPESKTR